MADASDPPSVKIVQMTESIGNLETTVGIIQTNYSEVTSSFESNMAERKEMIKALMGKPKELEAPSNTSSVDKDAEFACGVLPSVDIAIRDAMTQAEAKAKEAEVATNSKSSTANGSGSNASVAPPSNYDTVHPIAPMPHILNDGPPPMLNTNEFSMWKYEMESHISSSCNALWRIILHGFHPCDPNNLTPREDTDSQLNNTALRIIQKALPREHLAHIRSCKTAKEAWNSLNTLFQGNESIQSSKYDIAIDQAEQFVMHEDESPEELYRRLVSLATQLRDFGKDEISDDWIKRKFLKAITPFEKNLSTNIRTRSDYNSLNSVSVLSEFIAITLAHKSADDALARSRGIAKSPNLALKSNVVTHQVIQEEEEYYDSDDDDHQKGLHLSLIHISE